MRQVARGGGRVPDGRDPPAVAAVPHNRRGVRPDDIIRLVLLVYATPLDWELSEAPDGPTWPTPKIRSGKRLAACDQRRTIPISSSHYRAILSLVAIRP